MMQLLLLVVLVVECKGLFVQLGPPLQQVQAQLHHWSLSGELQSVLPQQTYKVH